MTSTRCSAAWYPVPVPGCGGAKRLHVLHRFVVFNRCKCTSTFDRSVGGAQSLIRLVRLNRLGRLNRMFPFHGCARVVGVQMMAFGGCCAGALRMLIGHVVQY